MNDRDYKFATLCLHSGHIPDAVTGSRAVPIYQTTSYVFDDADHAASLFNLQTFGNVYSRLSNPTTSVLEERIATLESGRAAVATSSGMSAEMCAILTILHKGDELVSSNSLYGGTFSLFDVTFKQFGINVKFVDPDNPKNFKNAITPKTRAIYAETIGNPKINVIDIESIAKISKDAGIPLIIDNTLASPYLCNPIKHGADIVVHSATKFIGGHGTTMGGIIIESGSFDWGNGNFPMMTEPSKGYHGVKFYETFGDFGYSMKVRMETMRTLGPCISPQSSWNILQGLETLHLRMQRHVENATKVAEFLDSHDKVLWVNYPDLKTNKYNHLAKKYLKKGSGSIITFGIKGGFSSGEKFIQNLQFFSHLANVGDAKSLVIHPASTTHRQLSEQEQKNSGVSPEMIRLSIGIEDISDILWDLEQAIDKSI